MQGCLSGSQLFKYDLSFAVPDMYTLVDEMRERLKVRRSLAAVRPGPPTASYSSDRCCCCCCS